MAKNSEKGRVKVFRFDPACDEDPEYKVYEVPYKGMTVLQVLQHVYEHIDPTLAFRFGCDGSGPPRCGACAMEVNDAPALACKRQAEKEMVVRPHPKFKIIKDLVVDLDSERG